MSNEIEKNLYKFKVFAYIAIALKLLFIFYFNYFIYNDALVHLDAVYMSKKFPDVFVYAPLAPASVFHVFSYYLYDYLHNEPYLIVSLYSLIGIITLAHSIYLFLNKYNKFSFYFYCLCFVLSATFFTFHYMPAWALSQSVFFYLLALDFNVFTLALSIPLFYVFHPLIGFLYYGIRAIQAYINKNTTLFVYSIIGLFILVSLLLLYISLNNSSSLVFDTNALLSLFITNLKVNLTHPYFTIFYVLACCFFLFLLNKKSKVRIEYLFLLSLFFVIPFWGSSFWISGRVAAPLFIFLATIGFDKKYLEKTSLLSIIFGIAFLLMILISSIMNISIFNDLKISHSCNDELTNKAEIIIGKNLTFFAIDKIPQGLCFYKILNNANIYTSTLTPLHPVKTDYSYLEKINRYIDVLDSITITKIYSSYYCKDFNNSVLVIASDEKLRKLADFYGYKVIDEFIIIDPCKG
jgi:hypothetical protein